MTTNTSRHTPLIKRAEDAMRGAFADLLHGPEEALDDALARYNAAARTLEATRSPEALRVLKSNIAVGKELISKLEVADEHEEVGKGMIHKRSDARERIQEIAEEISKVNPNLSPAEAFAKALDSEEGQTLRARYNELPVEERAPLSKGRFIEAAEAAESRETHPAVVRLREKAQEIRKHAAGVGEPISEANALARAMDKHPELKAAYYQGRH